jgi:hypothetical protein
MIAVALALVALSAFSHPSIVQAQSAAHITVTLSGQSLTAGFNNTVTVTVQNDFYTAIYDVDISVSLTTLTLYGDNHWHFDSITMGQPKTLAFDLYAPVSATGSSYQGTITITYKQLGDISYTQEVHDIGFSVYGYINLIMYGVQMTPATTTPGGNTTVSGNLLNSGNLAAYNANVSVISEALAPRTQSSIFIGEVDPNIPRPFSLLVIFKTGLKPDNYSVTVRVSAIDNSRPASPFFDEETAQIQIKNPVQQPTTQRQEAGGVFGMIFAILRYLFDVFFGSPYGSITQLKLDYSYSSATTGFKPRALLAG